MTQTKGCFKGSKPHPEEYQKCSGNVNPFQLVL